MDLSESTTPASLVMWHLENTILWLLIGVADNGLRLRFLKTVSMVVVVHCVIFKSAGLGGGIDCIYLF